MTFELNQRADPWRFSNGWPIPCRTTGDLLIVFGNHGNTAQVSVSKWETTVPDPATGCARQGRVVSASLSPNVDIEAAFNYFSPITNYLPDFYGATVPMLQFGEAAVNLSAVLTDLTGDPCSAFGSIWMHSRASLSDTADLKDYVAPRPTTSRGGSQARPSISTAAVASVTLPGFTRDSATLSGFNPSGTILSQLFGPNNATCSGTPAFSVELNVVGNGVYTSPRFFPRAAGTYRWVVTDSGDANNNPSATGCGERGEITEVLPHNPSLTTSASPPASVHRSARRVRTAGLEIYDSATLTGYRPTGHITCVLYGPNDDSCSHPIFTTATTVFGSGIYNSEGFTPTVSGTYRWRATYSGDGNNNAVGPTACDDPNEAVQVIVPAQPSLITSASDSVALGGAIHDTATLSGGSDPTGTITFRLYAPSDAPNGTACSGTPIFTSTVGVHGNGDYTSGSFVPTTAGAYLWVASYSGDAANHPASTACRDAGETGVVRPPDIHPVTPGFSTTASPPLLGGNIFDTAHLSDGTDPGGAITFRLFGPGDASCSGPRVFTAVTAVNGNGDYRSAEFTVVRPGTYAGSRATTATR